MNKVSENKMGVMPINRLLVDMALPMMISMLVQALYNIVDSVFVGQINEAALTAVSLAFPVQTLMIAFAAGTGVGINALLSRSLGEKKYDLVNRTAMNGFFLAVCHCIIFAMFGVFGTNMYMLNQTAGLNNAALVHTYGDQYLHVITIFSFGIFGQITCERLLQSTGKTVYAMISQMVGAIVNIVLDPIFIFGLFGAPKMGVQGAAIATVCGQFIGFGIGLTFNLLKNKEIQFSWKGLKPKGRVVLLIYEVGIPSIVMQAITSVLTFGMNKVLAVYPSAVAVFGVYFKINSFVFMPVFGLNNALVPIISYNYGAGHRKRIEDVIRLAIKISVSIMLVGIAIFQVAPKLLLKMFNASDTMLSTGIPALRIISTSFIFAGFCIIMIATFQAFGDGIKSLIIAVIRQLGILLPVAYVLSKLMGLPWLWLSFPLSEAGSLVVALIFFKQLFKEKISTIPE